MNLTIPRAHVDVAVALPEERAKAPVGALLQRHGGRYLHYYGCWTIVPLTA